LKSIPLPARIHFRHTKTKNMKKPTLTLAVIGLLAAVHACAAETTAPATSPATETPTYLKQDKPAEALFGMV
jgi:hypothetical protein